jgi:hypothetical protein
MTRQQIEEVLRNRNCKDAANQIHQAFKDNELIWFAITAGLICVGGIIGVLILVSA